MYLSSTMRRAGTIAGVGVLAVVGLIGWTRHPKLSVPNCEGPVSLGNPAPVGPPPAAGQPGFPVVYGATPFDEPAPVPDAFTTPLVAPAAVYQPVYYHRYHRYYRDRHGRRVVVVRRRPFRRSAEIVAGSAAGGAVIGALAGGGKGAGIGALAGGGAGYVYDRLTHKKKRVVYER